MPTYILGRNQSITAPGVSNNDVKDVQLKVSGSEQDVTVFGDTEVKTLVSLVDATFEVMCTATTATVGTTGNFTVGHLSGSAVVTDVKQSITPKGIQEFTVSYAYHGPATT